MADLVRPPVERDRAGEGGRNTLSGGQALIARLATILLREGGSIRTNLPVTGLVTDDSGRVTGVAAMSPEGPVEIGARRGVLLAPVASRATRRCAREHDIPGDTAWTMAPRGTNTGEPIRAAMALGAATDFSALGWFCPGLEQPDGGGSFTLGFRSGLMVDQSGRRYANECLPYDRFGREMAKAPERIPSWYVFDNVEDGRLPAIAMPEGDPAAHLEAGTWVSAATVPELAAAAGLPADALVETVERFNGYAEKGVDEEFGRGEDEYDTFFAGGSRPQQGAVALRRCRRTSRPGSSSPTSAPRVAWSPTPPAGCSARTARRSRVCTPPATPPPRSSARSTPAQAPPSAPPWSSPRWRWRTCAAASGRAARPRRSRTRGRASWETSGPRR